MADQTEQNEGGGGQDGGQTAQISGTVQLQPGSGQGPGKGQPQGADGQDQGSPDQNKNANGKDEHKPDDESPTKKSRRRFIIVAVVLLLVIIAGLFYWHSTYSEDTDDAQVDGDLYQVSSRVTGQVLKVYIEDNQQVQAGQPIAEIDPKDYLVALEQAQATLASSEASAKQATVNVPVTSVQSRTSETSTEADVRGALAAVSQSEKQAQAAQARVDQAKANAIKSQLDVDRYTPLVQKDVISKQQFDAAVAQAASDKANTLSAEATLIAQGDAVRQSQQALARSRFQAEQAARIGPQQVRIQQARAAAALADVQQSQARVDQARLNLSYCHVTAPAAGIVNKKNVQVGANLAIGQNLLTIVPLTDLWVTANFKETQLGKMRPGQNVNIKVDALGGRQFSGKVSQIGGATGSKLSLFPPENATGNYVKVVQRIPVRIDFTNLEKENGDYKLRPGFSVVPSVGVK